MLPLPTAAYDACLRISMVPPEALKSRDDRHNWPVRSKHKFCRHCCFSGQAERIETASIDALRKNYPKTTFFCIPQGQVLVELWRLFDKGQLPEVTKLKSRDE